MTLFWLVLHSKSTWIHLYCLENIKVATPDSISSSHSLNAHFNCIIGDNTQIDPFYFPERTH